MGQRVVGQNDVDLTLDVRQHLGFGGNTRDVRIKAGTLKLRNNQLRVVR